MKWIYFLLLTAALSLPSNLRAEDAATEERLNQLNGKIEDLIAGQEAQKKLISELRREIESLRDQQNKPSTAYASHEDLKRLGKTVEEVDRKRMDDYEKIRSELQKLGRTLSAPPPKSRSTPPTDTSTKEKPDSPEKGFEYVVKSGDTLSTIVKLYKEQNIKITTDQIMKANPGLQPEKMHIGQKIFIPAPPQ